jgi:signal transduction histidine kinase
MNERILLLSDDESLIQLFKSLEGFEVHVSQEAWYVDTKDTQFDVAIADLDRLRLTGNILNILEKSSVAFGIVSPNNLPQLTKYDKEVFHDIWVKPLYTSLLVNHIKKGLHYQILKREKSHFLDFFIHEIMNSLTPIMGFSDILRQELKEMLSEAAKQEMLKTIHTSSKEIKYFLNILRRVNRTPGYTSTSPKPVQLSSFVNDRIPAEWHETISKKPLTLHIEIPDSLPPVFTDEFRLQRVLTCLLSNAYKFTEEGGEIGIAAKLIEPNRIEISVWDTGIGLADQHIIELQNRIRREDMVVGDNERMRLGLLMISQDLHEIGSSLNMKSELGKGSTFHFTIPIARNTQS